jgi:hypothetical protein
MKTITDPFAILDSLGGAVSGDYRSDVAKVEKLYEKTFSQRDYEQALSISEMP